jgi:hypothetical protein
MFAPSVVLFTLASLPTIRTRRVGGIRFIRVGRWQVTVCRCRKEV